MNKKSKVMILVIVLFVLAIIAFLIIDGYNYSYNFNNATKVIDVIVKDEDTEKLSYYTIYDDQRTKEIDKFEVENNIIYSLNDCLDSYIDHKQNKVLNNLTVDKCKIVDEKGNEITPDHEMINIMTLVAQLEHEIFDIKVFNVNDKYYVMTELNVNWWSPYELYSYDKINNKLNLIYEFDGEEVIGIK
jgi:preprotein translocase subunit SecF